MKTINELIMQIRNEVKPHFKEEWMKKNEEFYELFKNYKVMVLPNSLIKNVDRLPHFTFFEDCLNERYIVKKKKKFIPKMIKDGNIFNPH